MKKLVSGSFLVFTVLFLLTACKKELNPVYQNHASTATLEGKWNLIRVYGGIAGIDENHNAGEIEWTFNSSNNTLTVNNTVGSSNYYSLPSGTYNFQQISNSNQHYLVINANELGQFIFTGNQIRIDENKKSTGEGACGFYLVLER